MSKLKPCPFCGGKADTGHRKSRNKDDEYYLVMCIHCFARTVGETIEEAEETWNGRADGWIPVSERLPNIPKDVTSLNNHKKCLCTTKNGSVTELYFVRKTIRGKEIERWEEPNCRLPWAEPIAWQPLPEPYKEVEE